MLAFKIDKDQLALFFKDGTKFIKRDQMDHLYQDLKEFYDKEKEHEKDNPYSIEQEKGSVKEYSDFMHSFKKERER